MADVTLVVLHTTAQYGEFNVLSHFRRESHCNPVRAFRFNAPSLLNLFSSFLRSLDFAMCYEKVRSALRTLTMCFGSRLLKIKGERSVTRVRFLIYFTLRLKSANAHLCM